MLPKSLCFSEDWSLTSEQVESLVKLRSSSEIREFFIKEYDIHENFVDNVGDFDNPLLQKIMTDYFTYAYHFCVKTPLDFHIKPVKKLATFLALCKFILHDSMIKERSVDESFKLFTEILVQHSIRRPPWRFDIFDFEEVKEISTFFHKTFFKHYKLYQYAFTREDFCSFEIIDPKKVRHITPIIPKDLVELTEEKIEVVEPPKTGIKDEKKVEKKDVAVDEDISEKSDDVAREEKVVEEVEEVEAPELNKYVVEQLNGVKDVLLRFQGRKLSVVDEKLLELEKKLNIYQEAKESTSSKKKK